MFADFGTNRRKYMHLPNDMYDMFSESSTSLLYTLSMSVHFDNRISVYWIRKESLNRGKKSTQSN